jgi:tRNA dimethylallyltransferase
VDASRAIKVFLTPERSELQRRIETRFDAMLAAGALEEVRALAARGLDPALPAEGARGALAHSSAGGRDQLAGCGARRRGGYLALYQTAGHLVPQPDAGLVLDRAGSGASADFTRNLADFGLTSGWSAL